MEPIGHVALAERRELATYPAPRGVDVVPHGFRSSFRDWAASLGALPLASARHGGGALSGGIRTHDLLSVFMRSTD